MNYLAIRNWRKFQHYKDRNPPWIKFYVELIDSQNKLNDLPVATRYLFDRLLLLAAKENNAIPNDPELIAKLFRMEKERKGGVVAGLLAQLRHQSTETENRNPPTPLRGI